ncbi:hypothetical protein JCM10213_002420 [Rhodosporidiobolus nylandii]
MSSSSPPPSLPLPLSTFIAAQTPSHPLPRLLTDPLLPRIAAFEAALLLSRPAALLIRLGLASERGLVAVAVAALAGVLVRWRRQWRAVLWALGVGEALQRTVRVLRRAEGKEAKQKGSEAGAADEQDAQAQQEETQHVLSFWLFFAVLSLFDSLRASSPTSAPPSSLFALPTRARTALRTLRHTYLRFLRLYILPPLLRARYAAKQLAQRYPRLDLSPHAAKFPSLTLPALLQRRAAPSSALPRPSFPQPRAFAGSSLPADLPLSWSYFAPSAAISPAVSPAAREAARQSAEKRWELVKLLLLWAGLRRDGWGAKSVVWDRLLAPLLGSAEGTGGTAKEWRVVLSAPGEESTAEEPASRRSSADRPRPHPAQDPSSPLSSATSPTLPSSATVYSHTWTPPRPSASSSSATPRRAPRSPSPTPSAAPFAFPTPLPPSSSFAASRTAHQQRTQHPLIPLSLSLPASARATSPASSSGTTRAKPRATASAPSGSVRDAGDKQRRNRTSLLFESPPRGPAGLHSRSSSSSSSMYSLQHSSLANGTAGGVEDEEELEVPPTPGEEEAEEGARGWGSLLGGEFSGVVHDGE